jgi:hypothetical protein
MQECDYAIKFLAYKPGLTRAYVIQVTGDSLVIMKVLSLFQNQLAWQAKADSIY